jgi:hypothetical protein
MTTKFDIGDHIQSKTHKFGNGNPVNGVITSDNINEFGVTYCVEHLHWIEESDAEKVEV